MSGLTLRVTAVMVGAMLLAMLITGGAFFLQREAESGDGSLLPLPGRVAAIVRLLEASPPGNDSWLARALSSDDVQVRLQPGGWVEPPAGSSDFPGLLLMLQRELGERGVDVGIDAAVQPRGRLAALIGRYSLRTGYPLRMRVELRDGRVATIDIRSALIAGPFAGQLVPGTALLILMTVLFSAWSLKRQIRPLETLATAVERFGPQFDGGPLPQSRVREVRQLVGAFERMRERIRALLDGRTRMLAAISHDLGTYLTRLRLRIEYIDDPLQRERAVLDLGHMQLLLRDTLTLARLDSVSAVDESSDMARIAAQQVAAFVELQQPVSLVPAIAPLCVAVRAAALERVLDNLIGNALKHAGSAEVSAVADGDHAELRVEDRGPGIPLAERELVLEPFYRLDQARTMDVQGSGLGLAIVADIVRRYRGSLAIEDRDGGGLRIRVRFPRLV